MAEDGVEAITELIVESKFGMINAVEEVITIGIYGGATKATGRGRREEGDAKFAAKKERIISVGKAVGSMVTREAM